MKKIIVAILLMVVMLIYPTINFIALYDEGNASAGVTDDSGMALLENLADVDASKAQQAVIAAEEKRLDPTGAKKRIENTLKKLKSGKTTYRKVFRNVYIVGDSLMNGLEAYDILNKSHLITQVSASLYHLEENLDKIVEINPPVLIVHYGINMISTGEAQRNNFINFYTKLIKKLKKELPSTRIIVSGIFPVDRSIAKAERFGEVGAYNKALKAMCKKLKVEFLDSSSVLKEHKECYGSDGIHLSKAFYEKYWLKHIIKEMEITL